MVSVRPLAAQPGAWLNIVFNKHLTRFGTSIKKENEKTVFKHLARFDTYLSRKNVLKV